MDQLLNENSPNSELHDSEYVGCFTFLWTVLFAIAMVGLGVMFGIMLLGEEGILR